MAKNRSNNSYTLQASKTKNKTIVQINNKPSACADSIWNKKA
jgi:hypothetical protein